MFSKKYALLILAVLTFGFGNQINAENTFEKSSPSLSLTCETPCPYTRTQFNVAFRKFNRDIARIEKFLKSPLPEDKIPIETHLTYDAVCRSFIKGDFSFFEENTDGFTAIRSAEPLVVCLSPRSFREIRNGIVPFAHEMAHYYLNVPHSKPGEVVIEETLANAIQAKIHGGKTMCDKKWARIDPSMIELCRSYGFDFDDLPALTGRIAQLKKEGITLSGTRFYKEIETIVRTKTYKRYILSYGFGEMDAYVYINGVLAAFGYDPEVHATSGGSYATSYIFPGKNSIRVVLKDKDNGLAPGDFSMSLHEQDDETEIFYQYNWPNEMEPYAEELSLSHKDEFTVPGPLPPHLWARAEPHEKLTRKDKQDIIGVIEKMHAAFEKRDAESLIAFAEILTTERLRDFFGVSYEEEGPPHWQARFDGYTLYPFVKDMKNYTFLLYGGGRLVHVKSRASKSNGAFFVLKEKNREGSHLLPLDGYFGKIGGEWKLLAPVL